MYKNTYKLGCTATAAATCTGTQRPQKTGQWHCKGFGIFLLLFILNKLFSSNREVEGYYVEHTGIMRFGVYLFLLLYKYPSKLTSVVI